MLEEMVSPERAREIALSHAQPLATETVPLLASVGRVAAGRLFADIDSAPFAHAAMDGFALRAEQLASASESAPVALQVVAEVPAGSVFEGSLAADECVRIMTGAPLPAAADSVVKYEIVRVAQGDGRKGSVVEFCAPCERRENVREAGEECKAGDLVVDAGEVIKTAGVGFLATCGILQVETYRRPKVAVIATGSELVDPGELPPPGKIRNSNGYALAALVQEAGGVAEMLPIVEDTFEALSAAVADAASRFDFVITTGGAANGDYDFIKGVVEELGELYMTTVNMRPGKAQALGLVEGTPVFGLPGNPAAAYVGFHLLIRPMLRKMQGFSCFDHPKVSARLVRDVAKKDPRRIYLRAMLSKGEGGFEVEPARNQSSGLFGPMQRNNCLAIMPEGLEGRQAGDMIDCLLLDVPEEVLL